jgi:hypothetical protein
LTGVSGGPACHLAGQTRALENVQASQDSATRSERAAEDALSVVTARDAALQALTAEVSRMRSLLAATQGEAEAAKQEHARYGWLPLLWPPPQHSLWLLCLFSVPCLSLCLYPVVNMGDGFASREAANAQERVAQLSQSLAANAHSMAAAQDAAHALQAQSAALAAEAEALRATNAVLAERLQAAQRAVDIDMCRRKEAEAALDTCRLELEAQNEVRHVQRPRLHPLPAPST